jgi:hypothetical protein
MYMYQKRFNLYTKLIRICTLYSPAFVQSMMEHFKKMQMMTMK